MIYLLDRRMWNVNVFSNYTLSTPWYFFEIPRNDKNNFLCLFSFP